MAVNGETTSTALPRLYDLVELETADSALAETCRRAEAGAEEGTVVRVRHESQGEGRPGRRWQPAGEGLYAALVLRPEMTLEEAAPVVFVAALALGEAIAEHVPALVELHYRWPNDVLLRHGKVAGLQLRSAPPHGGRPPWLVVGLAVNVADAPAKLGFQAASLRQDGESAVGAAELLAGFARRFLAWANRWADEGFDPVRKAWLQRVSVLEREVDLDLGARRCRGRLSDLGPQGELLLTSESGEHAAVHLAEFYQLPSSRP